MHEPTIIHEDENFLIVNKPSGLLVHRIESAKNKTQEPTLADWLLKKYPELKTVGDDPATRPGIVHRLDRDVSGVMVVPRNQKYFEYLKSLFQKRLVKKTYLALVFGDLKAKTGRIEKPIGIKSGTVKRSVTSAKMSKEAITDYRVKRVFQTDGSSERFSLLEVEPKTGRTHQIRVHLASIGHPIVGDALYGRHREPGWATRIMLHALSLELPLMEGRRLKAEAEPPADYKRVLDFLHAYPQQPS